MFWALAALLAAGTLVLVLRPLLRRPGGGAPGRSEVNVSIYRDQLRELDRDLRDGLIAEVDHGRARREIEARLLEDVPGDEVPEQARRRGRLAAIVVGLAIPLLAAMVYVLVGSPGGVDPAETQAVTARQIEAMVERLAARLKESPEDAEGWRMLGRSYSVLGRFAEAADAYAKAAARDPKNAALLADFADALAMARGQSMAGEPEQLVRRALDLDPVNAKALALAGTAAFERKDYSAATAFWERMLPLVPADSEDARTIRANVEEARSLSGTKNSVKTLQGVVRISPSVAAKAAPDDTVFVFARAVGGPPAPLAVLRKQVRELPLSFSLDDSMAMAPGITLSRFPQVIVNARVSKSGNATPQPGDLEGKSAPVANDARGVTVLIDGVVR